MKKYCKCGECAFLKNEGIDGYGQCIITRNIQHCGEMCSFQDDKPDEVQAVRILHHFQKWRRGGRGKQPNPTVIGDAIDRAIRTLRRETQDVPKF